MKARLLTVAIAFAIAPYAIAAETENPYKKVKVGEFATYKLTMNLGGMEVEGSVTQTVAAKTDKEVTLKVSMKSNGLDLPAQEHKIDLTKPYDPLKATLPAGTEVKVEKLKDGKEKLKAAGKEYDTTWEKVKTKMTMNGMEIESEAKIWQSKDLPLLIVKMEMSMEFAGMKVETKMELTETGKKSD